MTGLNLYKWLTEYVLKLFGDFNVTLLTLTGNHNITVSAKNVFDTLFFAAVAYVIVRLCVIAPYRFICKVFRGAAR